MKKVLSLLAVLTVTVFMASSVWASQIGESKTAFATFDAIELSFDVTMHEWTSATKTTDFGSHAAPTSGSIDFDADSSIIGKSEDTSVVSNVYLKIHSNLAQQPAGKFIYMYTNNKANDSEEAANSYNAQYAAPDDDQGNHREFNGLVRKGQKAATDYAPGDYALLQIKACKIADTSSYKDAGPKESDIPFPWDDQSSGTRVLMDKDTTGWSISGEPMETIIGKSGIGYGNWVGYGEPLGGGANCNFYDSGDVIMFFRATFNNVVAGNSYGTKSIKFVNMTE